MGLKVDAGVAGFGVGAGLGFGLGGIYWHPHDGLSVPSQHN